MSWRPRGRRGFSIAAGALVVVLAGAASWWALSRDDEGGSPAAPEPTATATIAAPTATPAPAERIVDCPVDQEICDFAVRAEGWVRIADAERLIADGSSWDNPNDIARLKESIIGALPVVSRGPRLASIGCPVLDGKADCTGAFSLTFTTLTAMERSGPDNRRGILTLGFLRRTGLQPQLTSIAVPDGDDRIDATITGGVSSGCSLSGMPPRTESECILAQFIIVKIERPVVAGQPPECPYLPEICALALKVEEQLKGGEYAAVAGSAEAGAKLKDDLGATLGEKPPRLIAIGCPFGNTMVFCDGSFAIVFTTLEPDDDWTVGGKMAILRFERAGGEPRFADVVAPDDPDTRESLVNGGSAVRPCGLAGIAAEERPGGCSRAFFEPYWSSAPFVPTAPAIVELARQPAAAPPANTVLYTASGPCWACDASDEAMRKHVVDAAGKMTTTTILENGKGILEGWLIGYLMASPDGAVLAALACDGQYCGSLGSSLPVATWRVVWSKDGGATWAEAWRGRTERATMYTVARDGFVVTTVESNPGGAILAYEVVRGTESRPARPPADIPGRADAALLPDGSVAWIPLSQDGLVVGGLRGEDGRVLPIALPAGAQYPRFGSFADGRLWAGWYQSGNKAGVFRASGDLEAIYDLGDLFAAGFVSPALAIGTLSATARDGSVPALADFSARTITPLGAPFGEPPFTGRNRLLAVQSGR